MNSMSMRLFFLLIFLAPLLLNACDLIQPEVIVVNEINPSVLISEVSFNGCKWEGILAYNEATAPAFCLPGEDRIHFKKFDGTNESKSDTLQPLWFNYQTISVRSVNYGRFYRFVLVSSDLEQDFSVPGPYGH